MSKICKCGAVMDDDMLYCTECGSPLDSGSATGAPASAPKKNPPRACPRCGGAVNAEDLFCVECGQRLTFAPSEDPVPEKPKCPKCGASVEADDLFCEVCGHSLKKTSGKKILVGPVSEPAKVYPPLDGHFYRPGDLD